MSYLCTFDSFFKMAPHQEIADKRNLSDLADSIRSKFQALKQHEASYQVQQRRFFKPLLENSSSSKEQPTETLSQDSISLLLSQADDRMSGVTQRGDLSSLGSFPVTFTSSKIHVAGQMYPTTRGLISLMTRREPQGYSETDLSNYIQMLKATRLHLTGDGSRLKFTRGKKYNLIIKPHFPELVNPTRGNSAPTPTPSPADIAHLSDADETFDDDDYAIKSKVSSTPKLKKKINRMKTTPEADTTSSVNSFDSTFSIPNPQESSSSWKKFTSIFSSPFKKEGRGASLGKNKVIKAGNWKTKYQYAYWDDINELVERLYLLEMSKRAGNTTLENEILNIEAELREGGYIY